LIEGWELAWAGEFEWIKAVLAPGAVGCAQKNWKTFDTGSKKPKVFQKTIIKIV
jgi:hypothetical protein